LIFEKKGNSRGYILHAVEYGIEIPAAVKKQNTC